MKGSLPVTRVWNSMNFNPKLFWDSVIPTARNT